VTGTKQNGGLKSAVLFWHRAAPIYNTGTAPKVAVAYFRRVAVMISESLNVWLVFVCVTAVVKVAEASTACACTFMPLNTAALILRISAARRMVLPVLSLFIVVVFILFSFGSVGGVALLM